MRKKQTAASTITIISLIASGTIFSVTVFIKSSIIRFLRTPFGVNLFCSAEDEVPRRRSYDLCACEIASVFAACHVIKIQSCFFAPDMIYLKKKRSASSLRECPNRPCRETARVFRYPEYNVRIGRAHVREQVPPAENTFRNTRFRRPHSVKKGRFSYLKSEKAK